MKTQFTLGTPNSRANPFYDHSRRSKIGVQPLKRNIYEPENDKQQKTSSLDLCHFDNVGVYAMCNRLKPTGVTTEASLLPWFTLRATVAVNTVWVIAIQPKAAGRHASNCGQNMKVLSRQFSVVIMIAILLIGTFSK